MLGSQLGSVTGLHPKSVVPVVQLAKTGAGTSCQVKVRVQVLVRPQAVAVKVNTWERPQPLLVIEPAAQVMPVTAPHSLVAVTAPPKGAVCALVQLGRVAGLQPRSMVLLQLPNTGAVVSCQLKTR